MLLIHTDDAETRGLEGAGGVISTLKLVLLIGVMSLGRVSVSIPNTDSVPAFSLLSIRYDGIPTA